MEGNTGPRIQPPPWASQNLGPALKLGLVNCCLIPQRKHGIKCTSVTGCQVFLIA